VPLSVNPVGAGLLPVQVALKPNEALAVFHCEPIV
jgi:hypothetical protein